MRHFVGALIRDDQGKLLAYKHLGKSPAWRIPGGKIESGETPAEAIQRELLEETGLTAETVEFSHYTGRVIDGNFWTGYIFRVTLPAGDDDPQLMEPHKCNALGWFSEAELAEMDYVHDEREDDAPLSRV